MSLHHRPHKFIHFSSLHFSCFTHLLGVMGLGHPRWDRLNSQAKLQPYSSAVLEESHINQAGYFWHFPRASQSLKSSLSSHLSP